MGDLLLRKFKHYGEPIFYGASTKLAAGAAGTINIPIDRDCWIDSMYGGGQRVAVTRMEISGSRVLLALAPGAWLHADAFSRMRDGPWSFVRPVGLRKGDTIEIRLQNLDTAQDEEVAFLFIAYSRRSRGPRPKVAK